MSPKDEIGRTAYFELELVIYKFPARYGVRHTLLAYIFHSP
ncbi:MAG: hypothetical protein U0L88_11100 [Acutalibacteraceae bacterium]|nr:hypothetical protein [Acutalibacteraceae bacterium]